MLPASYRSFTLSEEDDGWFTARRPGRYVGAEFVFGTTFEAKSREAAIDTIDAFLDGGEWSAAGEAPYRAHQAWLRSESRPDESFRQPLNR